MKIYTGTGDRGKTSLFSGERVSKAHDRIAAYGDVDEVNSVLGVILASLSESLKDLAPDLEQIQRDLFHLSAWLATRANSDAEKQLHPFDAAPVDRLEQSIDEIDQKLPVLKQFILPGGSLSASYAHLARTVCRRAERSVTRLFDVESGEKMDSSYHNALVFLNRLSDYLFVFSRYVNLRLGISDVTWKP